MSRYTGPKFKLSRRVGISLSGNGKDLKRPFPPGQHGPGQRKKMSGYGVQLNEKQKLRHMYGLNEKQFRNLFDKASKLKGIAGENFMVLLESRLDNWLAVFLQSCPFERQYRTMSILSCHVVERPLVIAEIPPE